MKICVIPTTDWTRHPVPNRLNFIFDILSARHEVYVLHFRIGKFSGNPSRPTTCTLVETGDREIRDPALYYIKNAFSHRKTLRNLVGNEGIEVILSANIIPSWFANGTRVPVVFDYLDHLEESASVYYPGSPIAPLIRWGVRRITRHNLRSAVSVITVTDEFRQYLEGVGVRNVEVIPNGVDTGLLVPGDKESAKASLGLTGPVIGYVGSLEYWVDLETVIAAMPRIPGVTLLVVGPGLFTDYSDRIRGLARDLGVADRIRFAGTVPYADLPLYIAAMDIGLNPLKRMEKNELTAGGKIFNYLSCGRPVLSSRMPPLQKMLGDALAYYDDAESFADQVSRILTNPRDPAFFRRIAEQYDWKKIADRYVRVLEAAC
ncbi:MAG: glycosyltransferase [Methanoregulaceae archaeon]|nr:glycosyltransferase [Methanoregulaceae archaeon]